MRRVSAVLPNMVITTDAPIYVLEPFDNNTLYVPERILRMLPDELRQTFLWIFIVITALSLLGNIAAIFAIPKRFVQKTAIVSLAIADILSTLVIGTNNLQTFSEPLLIWTLGSFLCYFIPMCQIAAILASSMALLFIAMDRYKSVVHSSLSKSWNPPPWVCIGTAVLVGLSCFGVSYPMYIYFSLESITIVYPASPGNSPTMEPGYMCVSFYKDEMRDYYISLMVIIFAPLTIVFVWFYCNIAVLVWKHRKPTIFTKPSKSATALETNIETKTTEVSGIATASSSVPLRSIMTKSRVNRKIRTFKVIITLMLVFISCRLPYFCIYVVKLAINNATHNDLGVWILNYTFIGLHIVSCALNPLLYTFLNQTLKVCQKVRHCIGRFVREICCFCFSNNDFEEFENENPFAESNRDLRVQFGVVNTLQKY